MVARGVGSGTPRRHLTASAAALCSDGFQPVVAHTAPFKLDPCADRTKYSWCTCGLSDRQPFCDGSHKRHDGCDMKPLRFELPADAEPVWLCGCKRTSTPPYCDGSHKEL